MRAVVYARTSTLDQAREDKVSIPDQVGWAKKFALERGWDWGKEYIEPGVTGDIEPEKRPALNDLLMDAQADKFDIVLFYHSSRLARDLVVGMGVCKKLGEIRKQVYFRNAPSEPVPPDKVAWGVNLQNQIMMAFTFLGDNQENIARGERVRSGYQGLARSGKLVTAPYGYKKIRDLTPPGLGKQKVIWHFELDPSKTLVVKRIFETYVSEGASLRQLMFSLNKDLIPSPKGNVGPGSWSAATIRNILRDPAYIGKVRWGRKLGGKYLQGKTPSGKQRRVFSPPEDWIITEGDHPKLIDELTFNKVQEKLALRYVYKGRSIASLGLLTGLLKCGRCGKNTHFRSAPAKKAKNGRRYFYGCPTFYRTKECPAYLMSSTKIHDIVINEIHKIASDPKFRKKLLEQKTNGKHKALQEQLLLLEKQGGEIESKQLRILTAYENSLLSLEEFGKAKRKLDEESINNIEDAAKIKNTLSDINQAKEDQKKFITTLKDFKKAFNKADLPVQKEFIQSLISHIVVSGQRVEISYRI